jgi:hypothetical protein
VTDAAPGRCPLYRSSGADRIQIRPASPEPDARLPRPGISDRGREVYSPRHANDHEAVSTEPLATYSERLLEVRRHFTLYDDRVAVEARWFPNRKFEHVVKLATLKGHCQEITVRYRMYRYAGWTMAIGAMACAACYYYDAQDVALRALGYVALSVTICGVVLMALTHPNRRIRFARFLTQAGRAGLDIGSAGNDIATFEKFVQQVRRQIH